MSTTDLLWIIVVGTTVVISFIGVFIGVVVLNQRKLIASQEAKLKESRRVQELLQEIPKQIIGAQEHERARLARDLHDGINQMLASVKYRLHTAKSRGPANEDLEASFDSLLIDLERTMEEVKRISHNLHPKALDDLGFHAAVRSFCDEFSERSGIEVLTDLTSLPEKMEDDVKIGLFRIIQESFQNIEKHANAKRVVLSTGRTTAPEPSLFITITDNGRGFRTDAMGKGSERTHPGLGITTMRERASLLGGSLEIRSAPNGGTTCILTIPEIT